MATLFLILLLVYCAACYYLSRKLVLDFISDYHDNTDRFIIAFCFLLAPITITLGAMFLIGLYLTGKKEQVK